MFIVLPQILHLMWMDALFGMWFPKPSTPKVEEVKETPPPQKKPTRRKLKV